MIQEIQRQQAVPEEMSGPLALLRIPSFFVLWLGGGLVGAMRWLEVLAIGIWTFAETGSAVLVALMMVLRQLPMLPLGPLIGGLAEQMSRRTLLITGFLLQAGVSASLALSAYAGTLAVWQVALGALLSGIYSAMEMPVRRTMVAEVAGHDRLPTAMGLDAATIHFTRAIGPTLGGVAFAYLGLGGAYAVAATFYFLAALPVFALGPFRGRGGTDTGFLRGVGEGLAYARRQPVLIAILLVTIAENFFGFPYTSLVPVLGRVELDVGPVLVGLLASADGIGGFVGSLVVAGIGPQRWHHRLYTVGAIGFFIAMLAAAGASWYWLCFTALLFAGLGVAGFGTMQGTLVMLAAPPALRGRMMGLLTMSIGVAPFGILHAGLLADSFHASTAMAVMATEGLALIALVLLCFASFRQRVLSG
jgi:MFS family permease